jgi:tripartite-type tricarboxylate transporter receptor subunit TctC
MRHVDRLIEPQLLAAALIGLAAFAIPFAAAAQSRAADFPAKSVRVVVSFPAGGTTDGAARLVGSWLEKRLRQPFVMENRPGANQVIASDAVAKSAPDGYTLLISAHSVFPEHLLNKEIALNAPRDLTPIAMFSGAGLFLIVPANLPARNLTEFIAWVKSNPGKVNWGSIAPVGSGTPEVEDFRIRNGLTDVVFVSYKGGTAGAQAVAANEVHIFGGSPVDALPHLKSGRARALAYTDNQRSTLIPDVPTALEQGHDLVGRFSFWVLAPAGTPADIVQKLNAEVNEYMRTPEAQERFTGMGLQTYTFTVEQARAEMRRVVGKVEELLAKGVKLR